MKKNTINHIYWQPLTALLNSSNASGSEKRQHLSGFDDEFIDIVNYIFCISHNIWVRKNVGLCYQYYAEVCPVYTLANYTDSIETIVSRALQTLAAFPDYNLISENIIWSEEQDGSYYTSHLFTNIMTHTGDTEFALSTGKTVHYHSISDCMSFENKIVREWIVKDNSFLLAQLGVDLLDAAFELAKTTPDDNFYHWFEEKYKWVEDLNIREDMDISIWSAPQFAHHWAQTLFNQKQFSRLHEFYHLAATHQWPGGRISTGLAQISGTLIQWLAQCPDLKLSVDHISVNTDDNITSSDNYHLAIRWSGIGTYQPHTKQLNHAKGERFLLLGCSHFTISQQRITKEVTIFDEVALYANIIRQSGIKNPTEQHNQPCTELEEEFSHV